MPEVAAEIFEAVLCTNFATIVVHKSPSEIHNVSSQLMHPSANFIVSQRFVGDILELRLICREEYVELFFVALARLAMKLRWLMFGCKFLFCPELIRRTVCITFIRWCRIDAYVDRFSGNNRIPDESRTRCGPNARICGRRASFKPATKGNSSLVRRRFPIASSSGSWIAQSPALVVCYIAPAVRCVVCQ
jgi:hypothetical protein